MVTVDTDDIFSAHRAEVFKRILIWLKAAHEQEVGWKEAKNQDSYIHVAKVAHQEYCVAMELNAGLTLSLTISILDFFYSKERYF